MMNRHYLTTILGTAVLATLGACSTFEPETYNCSSLVSVPELGARLTLAAETGELSAIRLNGIDAVCEDDGEKTIVNLGIGLKVSRPAEESEKALLLEVPFIAAKLDTTYLSLPSWTRFGYQHASVFPPKIHRNCIKIGTWKASNF